MDRDKGDNEKVLLLATAEPTKPQRRFALALAVGLIVVFAGAAWFAALPLWQVYPVVPALLAVCFLSDVITATLLFSQFAITQSRALLALASGYLFTALIVIPITLTYPGLFTPTGLLGAGLQTASWLYISWHFGFPTAVLAYALLKDGNSTVAIPPASAIRGSVAFYKRKRPGAASGIERDRTFSVIVLSWLSAGSVHCRCLRVAVGAATFSARPMAPDCDSRISAGDRDVGCAGYGSIHCRLLHWRRASAL